MTIGVPGKEGKTVPSSLIKRYLQGVVIGNVKVCQLVDVRQIRELAKEWPANILRTQVVHTRIAQRNLLGGKARAEGRPIDVREPIDAAAMGANIIDIQGQVIGDGPLEAQGPSFNLGRTVVRINCQCG